jgi:hypothetical protein
VLQIVSVLESYTRNKSYKKYLSTFISSFAGVSVSSKSTKRRLVKKISNKRYFAKEKAGVPPTCSFRKNIT